MVLSEKQKRALNGMDRTGLIDVNMRWPNKIVPYVLSDVFNDEQKAYIEAGLAELARVSCLTFIPRIDEENYVRVNVRMISISICFDNYLRAKKKYFPMRPGSGWRMLE